MTWTQNIMKPYMDWDSIVNSVLKLLAGQLSHLMAHDPGVESLH